MAFRDPVISKQKARIAFDGVAGVGKSNTGIGVLRGIVGPEGRIAVIDTEKGAIRLYAGKYPGTKQPLGFQMCDDMPDYSVDFYIEAIKDAERGKFDALLIDSASHAYAGKGGILELVDSYADAVGGKVGAGWRVASPKHIRFIDTIMSAPMHVVVTLRADEKVALDTGADGKLSVKKLGLAPIQRKGFDYEFDLIGRMDTEHTLTITKTRGRFDVFDGAVIPRPDPLALGQKIAALLNIGDVEWEQPAYARRFKINGNVVETKGVTYETYVRAMGTGARYEKATGVKGSARKLMADGYKVASVSGLTEAQAIEFIEQMDAVIAAPTAQQEAVKA